jgi:hypothetical protein
MVEDGGAGSPNTAQYESLEGSAAVWWWVKWSGR